MSRPKERDEQEALKLDQAFKKTLALVRPYIVELSSPKEAQLCRLWLEKLNRASNQRILRNKYLSELQVQLRNGVVGGVFGKPPTSGLLPPIPKCYSHQVTLSSSCSDFSDATTTSAGKPTLRWRSGSRTSERNRGKNHRNHLRKCQETESSSPPQCLHRKPKTAPRKESNLLESYKQRIETLMTIVNELQAQNERLSDEVKTSQYIESNDSPHVQSNVKFLASEVATLKTKLTEVEAMKEVLEKNHKEIVDKYRTTMTEQFQAMKLRLQNAQSKNDVLDHNLVSVKQKLEEITQKEEERIHAVENEWSQKFQALCQQYKSSLEESSKTLAMKDEIIRQKDLELEQKEGETKSLKKQVGDLQQALDSKIHNETKFQTAMSDKYESIKEDFIQMKANLEVTAKRENESLLQKIAVLKKEMLKMERSKHKLCIEYEKKISGILKDKEVAVNTLQLQLRAKDSGTSSLFSNNDKKPCQDVKQKYNELLVALESSADKQRRKYLQKLSFLEKQAIKFSNLQEDMTYFRETLASRKDAHKL